MVITFLGFYRYLAIDQIDNPGPYTLYDDPEGPECISLFSKASTCQRLIKTCYDYNSKFIW
jgi:cathepsin A (carboxypeptidase C)